MVQPWALHHCSFTLTKPCAFNHALDSACCSAGVRAMCRSQARGRPLDGLSSGSPLAADAILDRRPQAGSCTPQRLRCPSEKPLFAVLSFIANQVGFRYSKSSRASKLVSSRGGHGFRTRKRAAASTSYGIDGSNAALVGVVVHFSAP